MTDTVVRCKTCIMPSDFPKVSFDEEGVCTGCRSWQKQWAGAALSYESPEFAAVVEKIRDPNGMYDCLSGLSGGKDSCYAIYLCRKYGLRQIAVTFDNGFLSNEALANIDAVIRRFSIGHIKMGLSRDEMKRLYRYNLLKTGEFCSVCNIGIRAALYRTAELFKIKTIIAGTSPRTEAAVPEEFFSTSADYFRNVFSSYLSKRQLNQYLYVGQYKRGIWHIMGRHRWVQLPRYVPWLEEEILDTLDKELDWKGALWHQHNDCVMSDAKEYLNLKRFGNIEKTPKLSALVRDGQIEREKALDLIEKEYAGIMDNEKIIKEKISDAFDLTNDEMDTVLKKKHLEYLPGSSHIYEKVKKLLYR